MRVALVSQAYPPTTARGGIGTQTQLKARGLAARGHEVCVIACAPHGPVREERDGDVRVLRIPPGDARMTVNSEAVRWLTWSIEVARTLQELHAHRPLDAVDVPEYGGEGYAHLLNRADWERIPTAVHVHGPLAMLADTISWPEAGSDLLRVGREMEGESLRRADLVYASSGCSAEWCARAYAIDADAIPILHLGVDTDAFRPGLAEPDRPTILHLGALAANKGIFELLEAALSLAPHLPGLRLRLLGGGEPRVLAVLEERAATAGQPQLLEPAGYIGRERLPHELCRGTILAAPSRYEGGPGLVLLEAMACGLAVVACAGSGTSEVVQDGETGLLVSPEDPEALAAALGELLDDEALRARIGRRAREVAVAEYDCAGRVARLEALLESITAVRAVQ